MKSSAKPKRIAVKLNSKAEKMVHKNHPWIFETSLAKIPENAQSGDLAIIYGRKSNQLIGIGLVDLDSPIRLKMLAFQPENINQDWFNSKVQAALDKRSELLDQEVTGFRCLFGEADGLPGVICDVYDGNAVLKLYSPCWIPYVDELVNALDAVVKVKSLVLRLSRNLQRKHPELKEGEVIFGELDNPEVCFIEHGVEFQANLVHGHKTGFFLDHRANRKRIGEMAAGKTVLDVFSYAGGFSVHALVGGAEEVTSVDISKPALEAAKANARLNTFSGEHLTIAGDAFKVLEEFIHENRTFDIVVIDPPSFAKQKTEVDTALEQYSRLADLGVHLVNEGGTLVLASCSSRITEEMFEDVCLEALDGHNYTLVSSTEHDSDHPVIESFPEGRYLKCFYFEKR